MFLFCFCLLDRSYCPKIISKLIHPGSGEIQNSLSWKQFERNQVQPALLGVAAVVLTSDQAHDGVAAQESVVGNTFRLLLCHLPRKIRTPDRGLTKVLI